MFYLKILAALLLLTISAAQAGDLGPGKPGPADKCPVCGMFVAKYPDWVARITFKDGSSAWFDGVKDLMKYHFDLAAYNPAKKTTDIVAVAVTDYYALKLIDGYKAYYVMGSEVYGPMGKELIPFEEEKGAKEFLKDHKGKSILKFSEIKPELIKTLD